MAKKSKKIGAKKRVSKRKPVAQGTKRSVRKTVSKK